MLANGRWDLIRRLKVNCAQNIGTYRFLEERWAFKQRYGKLLVEETPTSGDNYRESIQMSSPGNLKLQLFQKIGGRFDLQGRFISGKFRVNGLFTVNLMTKIECYIPKPIF